ncbi:MAG: energy transducer TonB, partial [Rhodocyclaceae bacterium]
SSLFQSSEKNAKSVMPPRRAMLLSLMLHALALALLTDLPAVRSTGVAPSQPLRVSVRVLSGIPESLTDADGRAISPGRRKPPRAIEQAVRQSEGAVSPAPNFSAVASPADEGEIRQLPGGIPQPSAIVSPATVALSSQEENQAPDAAGLRQFRLSLASEARRVRNYPEAARRAALSGTAQIRVSVNVLGQRYAELARSSGHGVLDEAALGMLRIAAERCPLPESLRGKEFAVLLPVVFAVEE